MLAADQRQDIRTYWTFRDGMTSIDRAIKKGRHIVVLEVLQKLQQLHVSLKSIEKYKLLVCYSIYWITMNTDIENHFKMVQHSLLFSKHDWRKKIIHHEIPGMPWKVMGADMFYSEQKKFLCLVDYHSKFPVVKKRENLSADSLILTCKSAFFRIWSTKENNVRHRW